MDTADHDTYGTPATKPSNVRATGADDGIPPSSSEYPTDSTFNDLKAIGLLEFFETDARPILIFDLNLHTKSSPVYHNPRVRDLHGKGAETLIATLGDGEHSDFTKWAISQPTGEKIPAATYCGIRWTSQTLRNRWRVIAGEVGNQPTHTSVSQQEEKSKRDRSNTTVPLQPDPTSQPRHHQASVEAQLASFTLRRGNSLSLFPAGQETKLRTSLTSAPPSLGSYDILSGNPSVEPSTHIEFFQKFDWASTELGPIDSWSNELRRMANLLLADPRPAAMFWGENRIMMYNEPYVMVTGQKHPFMMGKPFLIAWAEIAGDFAEAFDKGYETGIATTMDNALFYLERHGYLEETYYSISMIPLGTSEGHMAL